MEFEPEQSACETQSAGTVSDTMAIVQTEEGKIWQTLKPGEEYPIGSNVAVVITEKFVGESVIRQSRIVTLPPTK